jgi:hypothetical protein
MGKYICMSARISKLCYHALSFTHTHEQKQKKNEWKMKGNKETSQKNQFFSI